MDMIVSAMVDERMTGGTVDRDGPEVSVERVKMSVGIGSWFSQELLASSLVR